MAAIPIPTTQQARKRFLTLPKFLQDLIFSPQIAETISRIAEQHHIPSEKVPAIASATGLVLLGFLHPEEAAHLITQESSIDPKTAESIANSLENRIFQGIRDELDKVYAPLPHPHEEETQEPEKKTPPPTLPPKKAIAAQPAPPSAPPQPTSSHKSAPPPLKAPPQPPQQEVTISTPRVVIHKPQAPVAPRPKPPTPKPAAVSHPSPPPASPHPPVPSAPPQPHRPAQQPPVRAPHMLYQRGDAAPIKKGLSVKSNVLEKKKDFSAPSTIQSATVHIRPAHVEIGTSSAQSPPPQAPPRPQQKEARGTLPPPPPPPPRATTPPRVVVDTTHLKKVKLSDK
ncbi:hypothetical protein D6779_06055 [Candidatus Parcubacteria bacterium]|nr:MAG: hypothetical protein D6779_06055 [Candidatus Parcubacteria bacterium]